MLTRTGAGSLITLGCKLPGAGDLFAFNLTISEEYLL